MYKNTYIGAALDLHSRTISYYATDSEDLCNKNKAVNGPQWDYFNRPISYSFNSHGHRSKEVCDLATEYFLVIGCSISFGVGLPIEETYPYLLADQLGVDYYNMSVRAAGIDTAYYNAISWLTECKIPPKFIVLQWPVPTRYLLTQGEAWSLHGAWDSELENQTFSASGSMIGYFDARKILLRETLHKIVNVPIIELMPADDYKIDLARDYCHSGTSSQIEYVKHIIRKLA
jgi:hypothetical protein